MPTTTQRIDLQGGDDAKRQLADLAKAGMAAFGAIQNAAAKGGDLARNFDLTQAIAQVKQFTDGFGNVVRGLSQAGDAAQVAGDKIKGVGDSAAQAGNQVETHTSKLASYGKGALIAGGAAVAFGAAIFEAAKKAADGAKAINDAADASGTSLPSYQKAVFVLQQFGLSADDANTAIKNLTDKTTEGAKKIADQLAQMGFRFTNDDAGLKSATDLVQRLGGANVALDPLLTKLKALGFVIPAGADQIKTAVDLAGRAGIAGAGALQKIKDATPDAAAQIRLVAESIAAVGNEGAQKQLAIEAFGDELGPKLVDKLKGGKGSFDEIIADFQRLNPEVTEAQVALGTNFGAAMARFQIASTAARVEFGSHFLPTVTEGVVQFTNLLRLNRAPLEDWAKSVASAFGSIVSDVFKLLNGQDEGISNSWLLKVRDAVVAIGTTVTQVFTGVVIPAFHALVSAAQPVLDKINEFFGSNLTLANAGIVAVLTFLVGGFNSLAVAVLAVFGSTGPSIDAFKAKLSSIGIDFDSIKQAAINTFNQVVGFFRNLDLSKVFGGEDAKKNTAILAETVLALAAGFIVLREGAALAAPLLAKVVGKDISGDAVLAAGAVAQYSGALGALDTVLVGIAAFTTIVANGFRLIVTVGGLVAGALAAILGIPIELAGLIIGAIAIAGAALFFYWGSIKSGFVAAWDVAKSVTAAAWQAITGIIASAWQFISALFTVDTLRAAWDSVKNAASAAWDFIVKSAGDLVSRIAAAITSAGGAIIDALTAPFQTAAAAIGQIINGVLDAVARIATAIAGVLSMGSGPSPSPSGSSDSSSIDNNVPLDLAEGGAVYGPGTTTSDSIPAWLSNFEFVQPAKRVFQYGVDFMEAIRRGRLPVGAVRMLMDASRARAPQFSMGGIVNALSYTLPPLTAPRFAGGGLATGGGSSGGGGVALQPLHIHLPGGRRVINASVVSPNDIARALNEYIIASRSRSTGAISNHGTG